MRTQNNLIYKTLLIYVLFGLVLCKSIESKNTISIICSSIWILLQIVSDFTYFKNKNN